MVTMISRVEETPHGKFGQTPHESAARVAARPSARGLEGVLGDAGRSGITEYL
jgi:hypothetical protein